MSIAAAHYAKFFEEILGKGAVWAIRDKDGFPTSTNHKGQKAMPFWSSKTRAQKIINNVPAYKDFSVLRLSLQEFVDDWLTGMEKDGLVVGVNWSAPRAMGYDVKPGDIAARLSARGNNNQH